MQADGQVYFDEEDKIPQEDLDRYSFNKAHAAAYALSEYKIRALEAKLKEIQDAEGR